MADSLRKDEYVPFAPDDTGQIKMAHKDCEHGEDHKERLYIRRMADGSVKAKCHNCGKAGVFKEAAHVRNLYTLLKKDKEETAATGKLRLPIDSVSISFRDAWPKKALAFLYLADMTDEDILNCNIVYSKQYNRVIIPTHGHGELLSWQGRDIEGQDPKYITVQKPGLATKPMWTVGYKKTNHVFITEDALSAYRISLCGHSAMALMGTSCSEAQAALIAAQYEQAIIFLDDDNATVKKQARDLCARFDMVMKYDTQNITVGKDPKRHGRKELCTLLKSVMIAPSEGKETGLLMDELTLEKSIERMKETAEAILESS